MHPSNKSPNVWAVATSFLLCIMTQCQPLRSPSDRLNVGKKGINLRGPARLHVPEAIDAIGEARLGMPGCGSSVCITTVTAAVAKLTKERRKGILGTVDGRCSTAVNEVIRSRVVRWCEARPFTASCRGALWEPTSAPRGFTAQNKDRIVCLVDEPCDPQSGREDLNLRPHGPEPCTLDLEPETSKLPQPSSLGACGLASLEVCGSPRTVSCRSPYIGNDLPSVSIMCVISTVYHEQVYLVWSRLSTNRDGGR